jgi:membrane complex biogenesis BtpA family protein
MPTFSRGDLIGMVHVLSLPGSPGSRDPVAAIAERAASEARIYAQAGFAAVMVENMHDRPYVNAPHAPETVAAMALCTRAVRDAAPSLPIGVQILSFGHREALAVAYCCGAHFIRVENFVYAHVADEGLLPHAAAGDLLRARRALGADIKVYCDIKKKHASHAITGDQTIADIAHGAEFFGADGLIVTGAFTGTPADPGDIEAVRKASKLPVFVGSGVTPAQLPKLTTLADALIVGSFVKRDGLWSNEVDPARCRELVEARRAVVGA